MSVKILTQTNDKQLKLYPGFQIFNLINNKHNLYLHFKVNNVLSFKYTQNKILGGHIKKIYNSFYYFLNRFQDKSLLDKSFVKGEILFILEKYIFADRTNSSDIINSLHAISTLLDNTKVNLLGDIYHLVVLSKPLFYYLFNKKQFLLTSTLGSGTNYLHANLTLNALNFKGSVNLNMGLIRAKRALVLQLNNIYLLNNIKLLPLHFEVILKNMLKFGRILSLSDFPFFKGEYINLDLFFILTNIANYYNLIIFTVIPTIFSLFEATLANSSEISKISYQRTKQMLIESSFSSHFEYYDNIKSSLLQGKYAPIGSYFLQKNWIYDQTHNFIDFESGFWET